MNAPLTEQAAAITIEAACRTLRLPTIREVAGPLAEAAVRDRLTHRVYLAEVFSAELGDREARRRERRIAEARFPRLKRLAEFDLGAAPSINPATLAALETCAWIDASEPVVLLGDSGTGKSHLLIGLGMAACEQGRRVRYVKNPSDIWRNVLSEEWEREFWDIPNVKANHPEKTAHPCQFPVELVQRCVLALSNAGDLILDPFLGVASSAIGSIMHDREFLGFELDPSYLDEARARIASFEAGTLKLRPLGKPVHQPTGREKVATIPESWLPKTTE